MQQLTRDLLIERFHTYGAPRERWLIGGEFERLALRSDGAPVGYFDPRGIRWILEQLRDRFGWSPKFEGEHLIELRRRGASITLEPGGQVELSGAPWATVAEVAAEIRENMRELAAIAEGQDIRWTALGLRPYGAVEDIPWVPKGRYRVMREYLPGDLAHTMMKATTSFQANFDYTDEADCARKLETMTRLSPLTTAIFANSPVHGGVDTGWVSFRGQVWTRTDPDRTGFPLQGGYSHAAWVDYLLDVPMMFYRVGGGWEFARGRTFREYMTRGLDGHWPDWDDWALHQTSVFPEVRVKQTIEIRGADAVRIDLALAGIALWTGAMYGGLDGAEPLSREFASSGTAAERFELACREGLAGIWRGRRLADWARDLLEIADAGSREADRPFLTPLREQIDRGESPGADALRTFQQAESAEAFLERVAY